MSAARRHKLRVCGTTRVKLGNTIEDEKPLPRDHTLCDSFVQNVQKGEPIETEHGWTTASEVAGVLLAANEP